MSENMRLFSKEDLIISCDKKTYPEVLEYAADYLEKKGYVKDTFKEAILKREEEFPTGLGIEDSDFDVAIPHTFPEHVIIPGVLVIKMENPVSAIQMGTFEDVVSNIRYIFMLLLEGKSDSHLVMLQTLMGFFQNKEAMETLGKANTPDEIYAALEKHFK